jgi:hypothetical protein
MAQVRITRACIVAGKEVPAGTEITVSDADQATLLSLGRAVIFDPVIDADEAALKAAAARLAADKKAGK